MRVLVACSLLPVLAWATDSCFGKSSKYDNACSQISTQSACEAQIVCLWGDPKADLCFAKDNDPSYMAACKKITSESKCDGQIGCAWRSPSEVSQWVGSISTAVSALNVAMPSVPKIFSMKDASPVSAHDHRSVSSSELGNVTQAWQTKYNLPSGVAAALTALVASESADFKQTHMTVKKSNSQLQEIAAGGRNWNGRVSLAFVFGSASTTLYREDLHCISIKAFHLCADGQGTVYHPFTHCKSDAECKGLPLNFPLSSLYVSIIQQYLQAQLFSKVNAEATLLKTELESQSTGLMV